jgi:mannobiose 2-epimerase
VFLWFNKKQKIMKKLLYLLLVSLPIASSAQTTNIDTIESQMRYAAKQGLIDKYYPRNIDTLYGGYLTSGHAG